VVTIDVFSGEICGQRADVDSVLFDNRVKFFDSDAWRLRPDGEDFFAGHRLAGDLGSDDDVDRSVLRQLERLSGVDRPVAKCGVELDGHIGILPQIGEQGQNRCGSVFLTTDDADGHG
jgi:hypothetical protein